jgi:hypothetical protein
VKDCTTTTTASTTTTTTTIATTLKLITFLNQGEAHASTMRFEVK